MIEHPADYCPSMAKRPICGVMSSAIVAKVNFDVAFAAAKRTNDSKRFRGGMQVDHLLRCLEALGVKFSAMTMTNEKLQLQHWIALRAKPGETYIVYVSGHYVTVRDDQVADQGFSGHVSKHRSRRAKVLGWVLIREANPLRLEIAA
jgi:hypothetical protein